MANVKISELPSATEPLNDADLVEIVQGGINKKAPKSAFGSPASAASESTAGIAELSTQAENNTGTDDARIVTPLKIKNLDRTAVALSDAGTIDITGPKHTLSTSSSRTFTISHTGDLFELEITLSAASATQTFPSGTLCISEGVASGDNTFPMAGTSGDKYILAGKKIGSNYYVVGKNFGQ